ncbi:hypothetical protein ANO11243_007890 [Dothideomycetidae sp. 11243]|nr:hypothetical protein ANO11243_007890 [fungal sp. No.11243]
MIPSPDRDYALLRTHQFDIRQIKGRAVNLHRVMCFTCLRHGPRGDRFPSPNALRPSTDHLRGSKELNPGADCKIVDPALVAWHVCAFPFRLRPCRGPVGVWTADGRAGPLTSRQRRAPACACRSPAASAANNAPGEAAQFAQKSATLNAVAVNSESWATWPAPPTSTLVCRFYISPSHKPSSCFRDTPEAASHTVQLCAVNHDAAASGQRKRVTTDQCDQLRTPYLDPSVIGRCLAELARHTANFSPFRRQFRGRVA